MMDFTIMEYGWPLMPGFYWRSEECKLLRGPFPSQDAAEADIHEIGRRLIGIILVPDERASEAC